MSNFKFDGLDDFQKDILKMANQKIPKETSKMMRKVGNKARRTVVKKAKALVKKDTGYYQKKWKRGKVFKGDDGETIVRVINSAPHAHLIEDGHIQKVNGVEVGFVKGKKPLAKGMAEFESSGEFEKMVADWLDETLRSGKL